MKVGCSWAIEFKMRDKMATNMQMQERLKKAEQIKSQILAIRIAKIETEARLANLRHQEESINFNVSSPCTNSGVGAAGTAYYPNAICTYAGIDPKELKVE